MAQRQPVGVLVGMAPWNAPIILGVRAFAMPIACGNSVVMKASEKCPGLHRMLGDVMVDAGLPPGVLNIISHDAKDAAEIVNALIDHPLTRRINFTGSTRVGRIIAERAATHLKPCLLELGGKAPLRSCSTTPISMPRYKPPAFGAFMNQGQICMSTEKVIVDERRSPTPSLSAFARKAQSLVAGPPQDQVHLASVVDRDTVDKRPGQLIDDAVSKGAQADFRRRSGRPGRSCPRPLSTG